MQDLTLYVRDGERVVPAPAADVEVARSYAEFPDKGAPRDGYRLTVLTRATVYRMGEEVRCVHICEAIAPGTELYLMGPKQVYGEYVDDQLRTEPPPNPDDPLTPTDPYDGRVLAGPGIDANYEITRYRFDTPGQHTIQWRLGELVSNVRTVLVG